jgi:hypothetical protein
LLPISVTSHIDGVAGSLNDGTTLRTDESGIRFGPQLITWSKSTWSVHKRLDLGDNRVVSLNPDGSDRKVIVTGCRYPDGIAIDVAAGQIYWTNMGAPRRTTAPSSEPTSTGRIARQSFARVARPRPSSCSSKSKAEAVLV